MTRVLLVHQPIDGGVGRHVVDLANGLADRGVAVTVCGPCAPAGLGSATEVRPLSLGRAVHPRADGVAVRELARIMRDSRPDIVHAHSSKAGAVSRIVRAAHPRVPLVYSPHGYAFAGYFERPGERLAYRMFETILAPAASRVICVCESEAALARSIGPSRRVRVVHNGVAEPPSAPPDDAVAELCRRGPVVGVVSHLHAGKGIDTLLDATPALLERHSRAQIAIVGDGPALKGLRSRAERLKVGHAVHFLGPRADPRPAMRAMDVFVLPSRAEAFPYVILEAMSVGAAIVATRVGGVAEALRDGLSGRLVDADDAPALARAVSGLLDDAGARTSLGEHARSVVRERFTIESMVAGITGVYGELLA